MCQNEVNELHSFHSTTGPECHKLSIGILYFIMELIQADLGFHFCFHDNISKCLIIKADTHTHRSNFQRKVMLAGCHVDSHEGSKNKR